MQKFLLAQRNMLTSCSILAKNKWSLSCAWKGVISHLGGAKVIVWNYMRHFCMRKREFLVFLTVATYEDGSPGEKKKTPEFCLFTGQNYNISLTPEKLWRWFLVAQKISSHPKCFYVPSVLIQNAKSFSFHHELLWYLMLQWTEIVRHKCSQFT